MKGICAALALCALLCLGGCGQLPGMDAAAVEAALAQYGQWPATLSMEQALDWADAVVQVEVLHDNALPAGLSGRESAVAVSVQQAVCGSVADSAGVNDNTTAVLWQEPGDPQLTQGQWAILAVREKVLESGETVLEYDPALTFYLHDKRYMISATGDNETAQLNGHTLEGLTERLWPIYHPGQTQFTRSLLDGEQRAALLAASGFTLDEDGLRMDYGRMRQILRRCQSDEIRLDIMQVQDDGSLSWVEALYAGGGSRLTRLEEGAPLPAAGSRVIVAGDEVIYGIDGEDRLICLFPEAKTFTLTGISLENFRKGLELIAP